MWLSEWKTKLASGLLAEVEPDGEHKSSFWFLKLEELLEIDDVVVIGVDGLVERA